MIELILFTRNTKLIHSDYTFDDEKSLEKILKIITPKFDGEWVINLIDPSVKYTLGLLENNNIPNYVKCNVYLKQAKLEMVLLKYPRNEAKKQSPWEAYMVMISDLQHNIDADAAKYLFKAVGSNVDDLKEALTLLDNNCEGESIKLKQVRDIYTVARKPTYASEVVAAFFTKDRYRWDLYNRLVKDLGESYAYNAIRKQVFKWVEDKGAYLKNEDVKNRSISEVDAPFINYVYLLFVNSSSHSDLHALMYEWDNRCMKNVERRLYANI